MVSDTVCNAFGQSGFSANSQLIVGWFGDWPVTIPA
jgi:hypothetical protein